MQKISLIILLLSGLSTFGQTTYAPDPTFGTNGVVKKTAAHGSQQIYCSGKQSSGKIITGGFVLNLTTDGVVNRINPNGTLDTDFGTAGTALMNFNSGEEYLNTLAVQQDDKIVVGGKSRMSVSSGIDGVIGRYNANGTPDETFGNQGFSKFRAINSNGTEVKRIKIGADGKIYGGGLTYDNLGNERCFVIRMTTAGKIDSTFGVNGIRSFGFSTATSRQYLEDIEILADGKILVVGTQYTTRMQMGIARLNQNGSLDNSFSTDGVHVFSFTTGQNYGIRTTVRQDGKYLVFGYANITGSYQVYGGLFNTDGTQDLTFGTSGAVSFQIFTGGSFIYDLTRLPGGDILLSGDSYNGTRYIATAYQLNESGALVASFGNAGKFSNPTTSVESSAYTITTSNSEIYLGGAQYNGTENAYLGLTAKLLPNGTLNAGFGNAGTFSFNLSRPNALTKDLTRLSNGNWMAFGTQENNNRDQFFAQFEPNGNPVSSFGTAGVQRVNLTGQDDFIRRVELANGEILCLAASAYNQINFTSPVVSLTGPTAYTLYKVNTTTGYQSATRVNTSLLANQFTFPIDLQVQPNGKSVVLANSSQAVFRTSYLIRHNPNNTVDNTFGNQGRMDVMGSHGNTFAVVNFLIDEGKFLVMNYHNEGSEFGFRIVKRDSTGNNDPLFGNNIVPGVAQHLLPIANYFSAIRLYKATSGYVVSGLRGGQGAVCLLTNNGLLQGQGYIDLPGFSFVSKIIPLPDGGMLIGGHGNNQVRIAKISAGGSLETNFGNLGIVTGDYFGQIAELVDFFQDANAAFTILARTRQNIDGNQLGLVKLVLVTGNQPAVLAKDQDIVVFPNPSSDGKIHLKTEKQVTEILLVDALGRTWMTSFQQSGEKNYTITGMAPLKTGYYQLLIRTKNGETLRESVIIQ